MKPRITKPTTKGAAVEQLVDGTSEPAVTNSVPDQQRLLRTAQLGARLAVARQACGLTQKQLSERVGKARATIVQYEQGRLQPPIHQVELMAEVLGVAPEFLAFGHQGLTGLDASTATVAPLPQLEYRSGELVVTGGYALADDLVEQWNIDREGARVLVLSEAAPAFDLRAQDRVLVNPVEELTHEHGLYVLLTERGPELIRLSPRFSARVDVVKFTDASGHSHSLASGELHPIGLVVAVISQR